MRSIAGCLALALVATGASRPGQTPQAGGQRPVFTASVERVRLFVAVFDNDGVPVLDLGEEDFVVVEDGVPQEIGFVLNPVDDPLDIAFVLDFSSSVGRDARSPKEDAQAFLDALSPRDCVYLLPFRTEVGPGLWGHADDPGLRESIDAAEMHGSTALYDAVLNGLATLDSARARGVTGPSGCGVPGDNAGETRGQQISPRRQALVVLTDGADEHSVFDYAYTLRTAWQTDIPIFPVAIGQAARGRLQRSTRRRFVTTGGRLSRLRPFVPYPVSTREPLTDLIDQLLEFARVTGGRYTRSEGADKLREAYDEVVNLLRASYLVVYSPTSSQRGGGHRDLTWHSVEVRVQRRDTRVVVRDGFHQTLADTPSARAAVEAGRRLIDERQLAAALEQFDIAVDADPEYPSAHLFRAIALGTLERLDEARVAALEALRLGPGVPEVHHLAFMTASAAGDYSTAWDEAIRAHQAGSDSTGRFEMLRESSAPPADLDEQLGAPRVFVAVEPVANLVTQNVLGRLLRELRGALSRSSEVGLVNQSRHAGYRVMIGVDDLTERAPRRLKGRFEVTERTAGADRFFSTDKKILRKSMTLSDVDSDAALRAELAPLIRELLEALQNR